MKHIGLVILLGTSLSGCGALKGLFDRSSEQRETSAYNGQLPEAQAYMKLQSFASCSDIDAYLQANFRRKLKESLDMQQYYLEHWNEVSGGSVEKASSSAADGESTQAEGANNSQGPADYSKTNTQVAGVDEPDIVKTDGSHIYTISGQSVQIAASWPAASLRKLGSLQFDGLPVGLMLSENKKLIVVYHPNRSYTSDSWGPGPISTDASAPWMNYTYPDTQVTRVAFYNVAQADKPALEREFSFYGSYLSLRRQGNLLRLIQAEGYLPFPDGIVAYVETWTPRGTPISLEEFARRRAALEAGNEPILSKLTLVSYLEGMAKQKTGLKFDDPLLSGTPDCQNVFAEEQMSDPGLSKVTSINLGSYDLSQVALLAPANQIYASETSLYLAHTYQNWWWGWAFEQGAKTYLHKFQYASQDSTEVNYLGSGVVDGYLLNQFSMDEHRDHLRIAVTDDRHVEKIEPRTGRPIFTSINRVLVLALKEGKLDIVGQTPDLAPGERIYAARFVGDKGYVVTFRQVDPLYTLDLSIPTAPKVVGELKIPGFSNYLHPISATHLLAVGQDADPATGRVRGLKISVFDVSDPVQPKEAHSHLLSDLGWSWSEAQYDHKAFTYFASRGLLGLPVGGYRRSTQNVNWWDSYFSELRVFKIDPVAGIEPRGSIAMNDIYRGTQPDWNAWWYGAQVRRSVFADDFIYAISDLGIRAVHNQDLKTPIATLPFYP